MSGMAGVFYRDGRQVKQELLVSMADKLAHRGGDGIRIGVYGAGSLGLVHCMLHDTPESVSEILPASSEDGQFVINFDGRLDNRQELAELTGYKRTLSETPDSSLVLASYKKWGKDAASHLLGDFAFVIWDNRERLLFCCRDIMGVKPFYYYFSEKAIFFASEIKGLLVCPEVSKRLNEERIADYLTCNVTDKTSTFYKEILRLPPGTILLAGREQFKSQQYAQLAPAKLQFTTDSEYEEAFREIFRDSVKCRLRSFGPVGSYLSGGLDSSSITCVTAQELQRNASGRKLHTFSGIFNQLKQCDEREYFNEVLNRYPVDPHYVDVEKINAGETFDTILEIEDEPFFGPHIFMLQALLERANYNGVRVMLDGHDGDAAISYGYGLLYELVSSVKLLKLIEEIGSVGKPSYLTLLRRMRRVFSTYFKLRIPYLYSQSSYASIKNNISILNSEFAIETRCFDRLVALNGQLPQPGQHELDRHARNIGQPLHAAALEQMDKLSAWNQITTRYPFFDKRIIEFCLGLPASQKLRRGYNRDIVRRSLHSVIPNNIRYRYSKTDFTSSVAIAFQKHSREWLVSAIDSYQKSGYRYINRSYIEAISNLLKQNQNEIKAKDLRNLLNIAVLGNWLKRSYKTEG
jgi:asparagine synthase (glutamine-hydrolysing)